MTAVIVLLVALTLQPSNWLLPPGCATLPSWAVLAWIHITTPPHPNPPPTTPAQRLNRTAQFDMPMWNVFTENTDLLIIITLCCLELGSLCPHSSDHLMIIIIHSSSIIFTKSLLDMVLPILLFLFYLFMYLFYWTEICQKSKPEHILNHRPG